MGTAAATAGAAGPFQRLRAGWSSSLRRTKPEYTAARGQHNHATFREQADASVRCTGLGANYLLWPTRPGPGCSLFDYLRLSFYATIKAWPFGIGSILTTIASTSSSSEVSVILNR
jgi:hypothetical protein